METGMSFLAAVQEKFDCRGMDVRSYSPLTLAFIGDCVYDLIIRTVVASRANCPPNTLHKKKCAVVKAAAQAAQAEAIREELTQEELAVFKRGRNAHSATTAKNATVQDYRMATGLEALYGWLYLNDKMDRLLWLVEKGLAATGLTP